MLKTRRRRTERHIAVSTDTGATAFVPRKGYVWQWDDPKFGKIELFVHPAGEDESGLHVVTEVVTGRRVDTKFAPADVDTQMERLERTLSTTPEFVHKLAALRAAHIENGDVAPDYKTVKQTYYTEGQEVQMCLSFHVGSTDGGPVVATGKVFRHPKGKLMVQSGDARRLLNHPSEVFSLIPYPGDQNKKLVWLDPTK